MVQEVFGDTDRDEYVRQIIVINKKYYTPGSHISHFHTITGRIDGPAEYLKQCCVCI
jgi:hypothetical protein